MAQATDSPPTAPRDRIRAPLSGRVSLDHGLASLGMGILVGLLFPPLAVALGMPAALSFRPLFLATCLAAGLVVGGAGWLLARQVIGRRVTAFAGRTAWVARVLAQATYSGDWSGCDPQQCRLPVDSADQFGELATSFNDLLSALVELHTVQDQLGALSQGLLEQSGLNALADWGLNQIRQSVGATAGGVIMVQDGILRMVASHGLADPDQIAASKLLADCMYSAEPTIVHLPEWLEVDRILATSRPVEAVALQLKVNSVPTGVLLLALDQSSTALQRQFLSLQAATLGLALHNASARDALALLAAQDGLTGLLNRRFGETRMAEEYARAVRSRVPLGLLMLDLDDFKLVNDTHGHPTGDKVLKAVATASTAMLREGDSMARFGGDEFLILLPGADLGDALEVAERIRLAVAAVDVRAATSSLRTTVSVGAASWPETAASDGAELVRLADEALFAAKEQGRNRVAAAGLRPLPRAATVPIAS
ncbi:MAG: GGDEF domain-containing protein [Candidatus Dormibacteria bacterium]